MVKDADYILVLEGGKIDEAGAPASLLTTQGWFAQLAAGAAPDIVQDE